MRFCSRILAAYLQEELEWGKVVYCRFPPAYETVGSDGRAQICKVPKPINGMAQAGRRWQRSLFPWLRDWGSTQCFSDPCMFTTERKVNGCTQQLVVGCYVDDLFTLYSDDGPGSLYESFTSDLAALWNVEDEGPVSDLLNVDITRDADCVFLQQRKYRGHLVETYLPAGARSRYKTVRRTTSAGAEVVIPVAHGSASVLLNSNEA
eukprot:6181614-Pleurochrysis_carterae.AAC.1